MDAEPREWCGQCDKQTRHLQTPEGPQRCRACHPLGAQSLGQFRTCPGCRAQVYQWDHAPCEDHVPVRQPTGDAA